MKKLDAEERQILEDFEKSDLKKVARFKTEKATLEQAARRTLQKDKRINI